jgi:hypothetical protein
LIKYWVLLSAESELWSDFYYYAVEWSGVYQPNFAYV